MGQATQTGSVAAARNGNLVIFAVSGLILATWMARLPEVKATMQLSPGQLGIMLLAISVGALTGLPIAGRLLGRLGPTRVVRLGALIALPGLMLAALGVTQGWGLPTVMLGLFLVGLGAGVWDVAMNLEGTVIEQALGRSIMPWFHAAFSAGTVAGALAAFALIRLDVPFLTHIVLLIVACALGVVWGTRRYLDADTTAERQEAAAPRTVHARSAWREPRTLLIGVMVLAAAFTEGVANDWLAVAFVDGHDVSADIGVLALTVFLVFMTAGRIFGTRVLDRHGRVPVLRLLFACAIVGSLLVAFGSTPVAFVGAAVWGLGASLGFPVGMSAAADDPQRAAQRLSVVSTIGYGAFLAGPALLGFLGDRVGILHALAVVSVVSVLALLVVPAARPLVPDEATART